MRIRDQIILAIVFVLLLFPKPSKAALDPFQNYSALLTQYNDVKTACIKLEIERESAAFKTEGTAGQNNYGAPQGLQSCTNAPKSPELLAAQELTTKIIAKRIDCSTQLDAKKQTIHVDDEAAVKAAQNEYSKCLADVDAKYGIYNGYLPPSNVVAPQPQPKIATTSMKKPIIKTVLTPKRLNAAPSTTAANLIVQPPTPPNPLPAATPRVSVASSRWGQIKSVLKSLIQSLKLW